jgi:hypothetical protein
MCRREHAKWHLCDEAVEKQVVKRAKVEKMQDKWGSWEDNAGILQTQCMFNYHLIFAFSKRQTSSLLLGEIMVALAYWHTSNKTYMLRTIMNKMMRGVGLWKDDWQQLATPGAVSVCFLLLIAQGHRLGSYKVGLLSSLFQGWGPHLVMAFLLAESRGGRGNQMARTRSFHIHLM